MATSVVEPIDLSLLRWVRRIQWRENMARRSSWYNSLEWYQDAGSETGLSLLWVAFVWLLLLRPSRRHILKLFYAENVCWFQKSNDLSQVSKALLKLRVYTSCFCVCASPLKLLSSFGNYPCWGEDLCTLLWKQHVASLLALNLVGYQQIMQSEIFFRYISQEDDYRTVNDSRNR